MVSRRNYFAITAVMLVVFFLFQFTNVALESWNDYENNSYAVNREELRPESLAYQPKPVGEEDRDTPRDLVVYIGSSGSPLEKVVNTWVTYGKKQVAGYGTLEEYQRRKGKDQTDSPRIIVINSADVDWKQDTAVMQLENCASFGSVLVFSGLPDVSAVKDSRRLQRMLGIREIREEETTVAGLHLYEGFLLGGEMVYQAKDQAEAQLRQDMGLTFPWYTLTSGARAYMRGVYEDVQMEEEDCPAVIWQNQLSGTSVFAVNGSYMEDAAGLGLLSAMWNKSRDYTLYPVVNAQNMIFANYPGLAEENNGEMKRRYGHTMARMLRDTAWPAIVAAYQRSTMGLSCMLAPQFDYEDNNYPSQSEFLYYMKRLNEQSAEVGLSGVSVSDTPLQKKLQEDEDLMRETIPGYRFASFYGEGLTDEAIDGALEQEFLEAVRTVITGYNDDCQVIGYQSEHVTRQRIISNGAVHTFMEDFRVKAVETALGYTSVLADISQAAYPDTEEATFEKLIFDLSWNVQHYWKGFDSFSGTTVSECDERIRSFLALDYKESREGREIRMEVTGISMPAWFVLRTDGEAIERVTGGEWEELEDQAYLIRADEQTVVIRLR